jgi:hypothetical protein
VGSGGGGATGRGRGSGGAAVGGAGTPPVGRTADDASGGCEGASRAAGGVGRGGGDPIGRGKGSGGAALWGPDTADGGIGAGGVAASGGATGRGVPQYPQNLLPAGKDLWHFGHKTWGIAVGTGVRKGGAGGSAEAC